MYLGVRVDFIRWDKELEEGVLLNWCSGVVSGPSMLTENRTNKQTNVRAVQTLQTNTHTHKSPRTHAFVWCGVVVGVLDYQVVQVGRCVSYVHKLAPVAVRQGQQPLHHLNTEQTLNFLMLNKAELYGSDHRAGFYLRLTLGVLEDGHRVRVGNRMAHDGRTKHPGQVTHVHACFCALSNPAQFLNVDFLSRDTFVCLCGCLLLQVDDEVGQRVSVGLRQVRDGLVHLSFAVVVVRNL